MTAPETTPAAPQASSTRKKAMTGIAAVVVLAGIAYGAYYALVLNHFENTDNRSLSAIRVPHRQGVGGAVSSHCKLTGHG